MHAHAHTEAAMEKRSHVRKSIVVFIAQGDQVGNACDEHRVVHLEDARRVAGPRLVKPVCEYRGLVRDSVSIAITHDADQIRLPGERLEAHLMLPALIHRHPVRERPVPVVLHRPPPGKRHPPHAGVLAMRLRHIHRSVRRRMDRHRIGQQLLAGEE